MSSPQKNVMMNPDDVVMLLMESDKLCRWRPKK